MRLMLRQADMPRGATLESEYGLDDYLEDALRASGLSGRAAHYAAAASYSKEKGFLRVSGRMITTSSAAQASKALAVVKKADDTFRQRVSRDVMRMTPIALGILRRSANRSDRPIGQLRHRHDRAVRSEARRRLVRPRRAGAATAPAERRRSSTSSSATPRSRRRGWGRAEMHGRLPSAHVRPQVRPSSALNTVNRNWIGGTNMVVRQRLAHLRASTVVVICLRA